MTVWPEGTRFLCSPGPTFKGAFEPLLVDVYAADRAAAQVTMVICGSQYAELRAKKK